MSITNYRILIVPDNLINDDDGMVEEKRRTSNSTFARMSNNVGAAMRKINFEKKKVFNSLKLMRYWKMFCIDEGPRLKGFDQILKGTDQNTPHYIHNGIKFETPGSFLIDAAPLCKLLVGMFNASAIFLGLTGRVVFPFDSGLLKPLKDKKTLENLDNIYDMSWKAKKEKGCQEMGMLMEMLNDMSDRRVDVEEATKLQKIFEEVLQSKAARAELKQAREAIEKVFEACNVNWEKQLSQDGMYKIFDQKGNCFWVSRWYKDHCEKVVDHNGRRMYRTMDSFEVEGERGGDIAVGNIVNVVRTLSPRQTPRQARCITSSSYKDKKYDVFLSHDWSVHDKVKRINESLKKCNLVTWMDDDERGLMHGSLIKAMTDGIDRSTCILVFVTQNYMEKVDGKGKYGLNDNCKREFDYAERKKIDKHCMLIPILMDSHLSNQRKWEGPLGMILGGEMYYMFSDEVLWDETKKNNGLFSKKVDELVNAITTKVEEADMSLVN